MNQPNQPVRRTPKFGSVTAAPPSCPTTSPSSGDSSHASRGPSSSSRYRSPSPAPDSCSQCECGGVSIDPGDIVFGDVDGVVVIPQAQEHAVLGRAMEKVTGENHTRDALRTGEPLASVFKRFGIL